MDSQVRHAGGALRFGEKSSSEWHVPPDPSIKMSSSPSFKDFAMKERVHLRPEVLLLYCLCEGCLVLLL
eukprot:s65_g1.t2